MKVQSICTPVVVPATFEDWKKKHFFNPELEPISYSHFRKRGKAPKLFLKHYNHKFIKPEPEKKALININIKLEFNRHVTPLFA